MVYNPQIHNRKSIRLKGYDYTKEGAYFITICTDDRKHFFGEISNGEMVQSEIGKIAHEYLKEISNHFSQVEISEFIVMPNHVHCILIIQKISAGTPELSAGTPHVVSLQIIRDQK